MQDGMNDLIPSKWCCAPHPESMTSLKKACSSVYRGGGGIWGAATRQNKAVKSSIVGLDLEFSELFSSCVDLRDALSRRGAESPPLGRIFLKIAGFYFPFISPTGAPTIHTVALCGLNSGTSLFFLLHLWFRRCAGRRFHGGQRVGASLPAVRLSWKLQRWVQVILQRRSPHDPDKTTRFYDLCACAEPYLRS